MGIINHNFDKKQYKMKLALATLALVQANEDPRAFVNVDGFMTSTPVTWWNKHPAEKRLKWLENNVDKFFETHFVGNWVWETPGANNPGMNLRQHFRKYVSQMKTIEARCKPGSRKRRDEDEAEGQANSNDEEEDADFMETSTGDRTRKVTGNIVKDVDRFTKNLARWAKYEIYDQGGKCEFYGLRLLNRMDRLRWYVHYRYCAKVDSSVNFCDKYYWAADGVTVRKNPRDQSHWIQNAFERPSKN